jgi:serine/threonine protein kinase
MMNILHHPRLTRLVEVYDYKDGMTLISELATGGELLDVITKQKYITEIEIARYIAQVTRRHGKLSEKNYCPKTICPKNQILRKMS